MTRDSLVRSPALLGSVLLHAALVGAMLVSWPWTRELKLGTAVPVNVVANAPRTDLRPAIEAPEPQAAQTETPDPAAPFETVTPEPEPSAAQPQPKTAPQAQTKAAPAQPKPAPKAPPTPAKKSEPAPKAERSGLDFDALLEDITKSNRSGSTAQKSAGQKGPSRPETAPEARPDAGQGLSASALAGLADELQRRWNPNCTVEGGREVQVRVTFTLGSAGQVVGDVSSQIRSGPATAVAQAAAERAVRAVHAASPFRNLPHEFYGQKIAVNFNAREACD